MEDKDLVEWANRLNVQLEYSQNGQVIIFLEDGEFLKEICQRFRPIKKDWLDKRTVELTMLMPGAAYREIKDMLRELGHNIEE